LELAPPSRRYRRLITHQPRPPADGYSSFTCRQLAVAVLERHGVTDYDKGVLQRVTNSVNATLRAKEGVLVSANDDWPAKWSIAVRR